GQLRREHRAHAREERAAWIGGELRVGDPALVASGPVGAALQEAIRVGDIAPGEREAVQHREAVEPVVHAAIADLPFRRARAKQGSLKPGGKLTLDRESREVSLVVERIEAVAGGGAGGAVSDGAHRAS